MVDTVSGCDIPAHLRKVLSVRESVEKATASLRAAWCDGTSASLTDSATRLSDGQSEMVEMATSELSSAVHQLNTALNKLMWELQISKNSLVFWPTL